MFKTLLVAGDPILDVYITLDANNRTSQVREVYGGSANVYRNAEACLIKYQEDILSEITVAREPEIPSESFYKLLRIDKLPKSLISTIDLDQSSCFYRHYNSSQVYENESSVHPDSVFIFSDYNKGFLNYPLKLKHSTTPKIKLAVVDSKYRTMNLEYLHNFETKIFRCTGSEYCPNFASNFDYTIWTDGPNPIKLLDKNQNVLQTFIVPKVEPVDTCGAGDTFTAAFSCYLLLTNLEIQNIEKAILYAIDCSLEVIQIEGTAITTNIL